MVAWAGGLALSLGGAGVGCGGDSPGDDRGDMEGGIGVPSGDGTAGAGDAGGSGESGQDADDDDDDDEGACQHGEVDFTFLWVANSPEGTVSKIDTRTATEVARYMAGPDASADPSRTSVDLTGDVAVLNRGGSVTKIAALEERCVDQNGDGTIQTSTGPQDVLPWGSDECVLWHQALGLVEPEPGDHVWGPRPVAWDGGIPDPEDSCKSIGARVWVGWFEGTEVNAATFRRLDGGSGQTLDEVTIQPWSPLPIESNRPYGGATDKDGNFWVLGKPNVLVRIDGATLEVEQFFGNAIEDFYGLALDKRGHPWIAECSGGISHFDPETGGFRNVGDTDGCLRGIQVDTEGRAWAAGNDPCRLVVADTETDTIIDQNIPLPGCGQPVGISIDVDGYVWVVDKDANVAFKVDPDTYVVEAEVAGLVSPYTYSDMTGAGLRLQFTPEG